MGGEERFGGPQAFILATRERGIEAEVTLDKADQKLAVQILA